MEENEIVFRFLDADICLHPTALQEIKNNENPSDIVERLIQSSDRRGSIVTLDDLQGMEVVIRGSKKRLAAEYDSEIKLRDISTDSPRKGDVEGFVEFFNSRYNKGADVFKDRKTLHDTLNVEQISNHNGNTEVKLIGIVENIRTSKKGNTIISLEDPTGVIPVVVLKSDTELMEEVRTIVYDDIICIEGTAISKDGEIIIAKGIHFPDVPFNKPKNNREEPLAIAMISDIHIGSYEFMESEFMRFIKWLNCDDGIIKRQREFAEKVKYIVIAGDLVDGVGIYPGQIDDLTIKDIYNQYKRLSELLDMIPDHIEIIISPGNHDATRQAEPQPPIFEDFAKELYSNPRIHMVGNPCYANLHGINTLIYHGRSMDDIISKIPGNSYTKPGKAMLNLIKKRQLVPIFGEKVPVTPSCNDSLFIDEVPDIFHCGHVHTTDVMTYRGVTLVNSGAFQSQTEFQKRMNLQPDPGKVPVYDIATRNTTIMHFT